MARKPPEVEGWLLSRAPAFRLLSPPDLRTIRGLARSLRLPCGAVVFSEGQRAEGFHLVLSGTVRIVRSTADGDQITVLYLSAGEVFGMGAPLGASVRQETAYAAESCLILTWPCALWQDFANRYPGFATEALRSFGKRSDELGNRIVELSTKPVEARIACALLRLLRQSGHKVAGGIEIRIPISRRHVADMTGTTLHTVSRVLSRWEKLRLVESTRCHIVVTDSHRLFLICAATARGPGVDGPAADQHGVTARPSSARNAISSNPYSAQASITV